MENLALACQGCNSYKHIRIEAQDPVNEELVPLFHPRNQRWSEHFAWDHGCLHIVGLTATGRATVKALRLNRDSLVNLRRVLYTLGEHPPLESPSNPLGASGH